MLIEKPPTWGLYKKKRQGAGEQDTSFKGNQGYLGGNRDNKVLSIPKDDGRLEKNKGRNLKKMAI